MRNEFVFELLDSRLDVLLQLFGECPEDKRRVIPEGFNNHIHWHVGHVLTVTEFHVLGLSERPKVLPERYQALFAYGTKPADWQEEPPAWEVLIAQLQEQRYMLRDSLQDKLDVPVKPNFLKAETIDELIVSTVLHMLNHVGVVSAMLKVLKAS